MSPGTNAMLLLTANRCEAWMVFGTVKGKGKQICRQIIIYEKNSLWRFKATYLSRCIFSVSQSAVLFFLKRVYPQSSNSTYTQEKWKHVYTKLVDKCSKQRNSEYLKSGKNSHVHQLTNGQNVFYPVNDLLSIPQ